MFLLHRDPRVKTQSYVDVRRRCHRRRTLLGGAASGDPSQLVAVVVIGRWCFLVCGGDCGGALVPCGKEVRRAHGGVASGWRAWCGGVLGDD
jgi:hypothetical protein